jgi:hypothetical protein
MSFPIAFLLVFTVGLAHISVPFLAGLIGLLLLKFFPSHISEFFAESSEDCLLRISTDGRGVYVEGLGEETV